MNEAIYDVTNLYEAVKVNDKLAKENHELYKKLNQYKNNWEELKKWISTEARIELYRYGKSFRTFLDEKEILNKMKELEENK